MEIVYPPFPPNFTVIVKWQDGDWSGGTKRAERWREFLPVALLYFDSRYTSQQTAVFGKFSDWSIGRHGLDRSATARWAGRVGIQRNCERRSNLNSGN